MRVRGTGPSFALRAAPFALLLFAGGGILGWRVGRSHADTARPEAPGVGAAAATCIDPAAMEANANLVGQVRDFNERLGLAQAAARDGKAKPAVAGEGSPEQLAVANDEWSRMAREGTFRVRVPCASWDSSASFETLSPDFGAASSQSLENARRADAAGLSPEELGALEGVYRQVNARTWRRMQGVCETNDEYRKAAKKLPPDATDYDRAAMCRSSVLSMSDDASVRAMKNAAELRAAGAPIGRTKGEVERVFFAATESTGDLYSEMERVLGRDKARRAIDYGVVCLDESIYMATRHDEG
jgi:hypothetical protein